MKKNPRLSAIIDRLLQQPTQVASVHLVVGDAVPFSDEQLRAQWEESPLAQTLLVIRHMPIEQQCMACFEKYQPARTEVSCPNCGSVGAKIIAGEEFYLESTEIQNG